jgi:hypothetical protein
MQSDLCGLAVQRCRRSLLSSTFAPTIFARFRVSPQRTSFGGCDIAFLEMLLTRAKERITLRLLQCPGMILVTGFSCHTGEVCDRPGRKLFSLLFLATHMPIHRARLGSATGE